MAKQIGYIGYKILIDVDRQTTVRELRTMIRRAVQRVVNDFMKEGFNWDEFLQKLQDLPESTFTGEGIYISIPPRS